MDPTTGQGGQGGQGGGQSQSMCQCDPQYKIICEGLSAKNHKGHPGQCTEITFSVNEEPPYDRWRLRCFKDSPCYGIRNDGTGYWATERGDKVLGCPNFDESASKWRIEFVGGDKNKIVQCKGNLAWTKRDDVLYLEEYRGLPNQHFEIAFIGIDLLKSQEGGLIDPSMGVEA